jgi:pyruvate-ferredoxin/flavodoxin oxidoreductase
VDSGYWPLYRFDPARESAGEHPFPLDSKQPTMPLRDFAAQEGRYSLLARSKPDLAERLMTLAQEDVNERWHLYEQLAGVERHAPDDSITRGAETEKTVTPAEEELP